MHHTYQNSSQFTLSRLQVFVLLLLISLGKVLGQEVIFYESFGLGSGQSGVHIEVEDYKGWDNQTPIEYTGSAQVRITEQSNREDNGVPGGSGEANIFFPIYTETSFTISGINTRGYSDLRLELLHYKGRNDMSNELLIEFSENGSLWNQLSYSRQTGPGTTKWVKIVLSEFLPSLENLQIRFTKPEYSVSGGYFRIDDIVIIGIPFANSYTISASADAGGSISPSGNISVDHGGSQTFIITTEPGYEISDVIVDGAGIGAVGSYTFSNVTTSHTIHVIFEPIPFNINPYAQKSLICAGENVQLFLNGSGGAGQIDASWTSDPPVHIPSGVNPVVQLFQTTTFFATATTYYGQTSYGSFVVEVRQPPNLICSNIVVCEDDASFLLSERVHHPYGKGYFVINGQIITAFNPAEFIPGQNQQIIFNWIDHENICNASCKFFVEVKANPVADAGQDQDVGYGASTILNGGASGNEPFTFLWTPATHLMKISGKQVETRPLYETQIFTLLVIDGYGCRNSDQVIIEVGNAPESLHVDPTAYPSVICAGSSVQLRANATGGVGELKYNWFKTGGGFISKEPNPIVTATETTEYTITVTDENDNFESETIIIFVNPLPVFNPMIDLFPKDISICRNEDLLSLLEPFLDWFPEGYFTVNEALLDEFDPGEEGSGIYQLVYTIRDEANGCANSKTFNIIVKDAPKVFAGADQSIAYRTGTVIDDAVVTIPGGGSFVYQWEPSALLDDAALLHPAIPELRRPQQFTLTAIHENGCSASDHVFIDVTGIPDAFPVVLAVVPSEAMASVTLTGTDDYEPDDLVSIAAYTPIASGWVHSHWSGDDVGMLQPDSFSANASFTMPEEEVYLEAVFSQCLHELSVNITGNGTVKVLETIHDQGDEFHDEGLHTYTAPCNGNIVISFIADTGYEVESVAVNGEALGVIDEYLISDTQEDYVIEVIFARIYFTLTYRQGNGGRIEGEAFQRISYGDDGAEVRVVPNPGVNFTGWSDGRTDNPRTDRNVTANVDVTAEYDIIFYGVTFRVNMLYAGKWVKDSDRVFMTGSMFNYAEPGNVPEQEMLPGAGEDQMVLSTTLQLPMGRYFYKYFLNAGWGGEEWPSAPVRVADVSENSTFYDYFGSPGGDPTSLKHIPDQEIHVYPNPASHEMHVRTSGVEPISAVRLISLTGQTVYHSDVAGLTNHTINVSLLRPGIYILQVQTFRGLHTVRVLVGF